MYDSNCDQNLRNDPNCASVEIKLTSPVDSYATIIPASADHLRQTSFLGGVEGLNGSVWPCEGPGF